MSTVAKSPVVTVKVVAVAAPAAKPVVATVIQAPADHPSASVGVGGGIIVKTATGNVVCAPGDYVVPDPSGGGVIVVPAAFFSLYYKVSK